MLNPESPPEIQAARWFNAETPPTLKGLKGKVVVVAAFQQHCPGSVKHGLPQAARLSANFSEDEVTVIGLNVPFEDHDKQTAASLETFIESHELEFPIALDKPGVGGPNASGLPKTFEAYELQGTPAILVFDRQGRLRRHYLGQVEDVRLGAEIMALAIENRDAPREQSIALERRLAATLVDPNAHTHEGGCCGGHGHSHDHGHGHGHSHEHAHGDGCCGGAHAHCDDHAHDHAHAEPAPAAAKGGKKAKAAKAGGGCGDPDCGCAH